MFPGYPIYQEHTTKDPTTTVRVVEYVQGTNGYILSHEIFLYVFNAAFMFIAILIFVFWYPSAMLGLRKRSKETDPERYPLSTINIRQRAK